MKAKALGIIFVTLVLIVLATPILSQRYPIPDTGNVRAYGPIGLVWTGHVISTNGLASFYITHNGLPDGPAIFTGIDAALASCRYLGTNAFSMPVASIRSISSDFKTVVVNVITGTNITVTGTGTFPTSVLSGGTNSVFLFVVGK